MSGTENFNHEGYNATPFNDTMSFYETLKAMLRTLDKVVTKVNKSVTSVNHIEPFNGNVNLPKDVFWCEYGMTSAQQISDAVNEGFLPAVWYDNKCYIYAYETSLSHTFITLVTSIAETQVHYIGVGKLLDDWNHGYHVVTGGGGGGAVNSVNGMTGDVVLDAEDVGALADDTPIHNVPSGGTSNQVLAKNSNTDYDLKWVNQSGGGGGAVDSVNGMTGDVVLDAEDVGALPSSYVPPVSSVNGETGAVVLDASDVGALPSSYVPPVSSVNGETGAVVLDASDVGALPSSYVPPVSSVNGETGAVVLDASDVGALPSNTPIHNVPSGGTSGQILAKASATDYDLAWINNSGNDIFIAEYEVTTFADLYAAYTAGKKLMLKVDSSTSSAPQITYIPTCRFYDLTSYSSGYMEFTFYYAAGSSVRAYYCRSTTGWNNSSWTLMQEVSTSPTHKNEVLMSTGVGWGSRKIIELLWTNDSPTATFAPQTVSLDLANYSAVIVFARTFASGDSNYGIVNMFCLKGLQNYMFFGATSNNRNGRRVIEVSDTGVTFAACNYNNGTNNNYGVPLYIYGVRF